MRSNPIKGNMTFYRPTTWKQSDDIAGPAVRLLSDFRTAFRKRCQAISASRRRELKNRSVVTIIWGVVGTGVFSLKHKKRLDKLR